MTHSCIPHSLLTVVAYERYHTKSMRDELVRKNGRVRLKLHKVDGWMAWVYIHDYTKGMRVPTVGMSAIMTLRKEFANLGVC